MCQGLLGHMKTDKIAFQIELKNVVIRKAQVEYDRKFSHHEETKITKQRQNILSFSLRVLRALRGEKCLA